MIGSDWAAAISERVAVVEVTLYLLCLFHWMRGLFARTMGINNLSRCHPECLEFEN